MLQELGAVYELSEGEYIGYRSRCQSQQNILDFWYGGDKGPPQIMCMQPEYKLHCSVGETIVNILTKVPLLEKVCVDLQGLCLCTFSFLTCFSFFLTHFFLMFFALFLSLVPFT